MIKRKNILFCYGLIVVSFLPFTVCLLPPHFQWKVLDFTWQDGQKEAAIVSGAYIPENNMPSGLARWKDKVFITIPRWKKGVPSSLNYLYVNGSQQQALNPYPSWKDAFVPDNAVNINTASTVVSAFKIYVDRCDRLWVVDNGATDMCKDVRQIAPPALLAFDLKRNTLKYKHIFEDATLRNSTVFTSIVVDIIDSDCSNAFAYISDMGSGAIVVFDLKNRKTWRVESHHFQYDKNATEYRVGGVDFFWNDGVSSVALSQKKNDGYRDLYCYPTSSTKIVRMSTKLLRNSQVTADEICCEVKVVGDRGPLSQSTACDYDWENNVLFYTQLCKNGIGCWNLDRKFSPENMPLLISDCKALEFPNDIKVDSEGKVWILSDRQSRFLYDTMDFNDINFRVLSADASDLIRGTRCQLSIAERIVAYLKK